MLLLDSSGGGDGSSSSTSALNLTTGSMLEKQMQITPDEIVGNPESKTPSAVVPPDFYVNHLVYKRLCGSGSGVGSGGGWAAACPPVLCLRLGQGQSAVLHVHGHAAWGGGVTGAWRGLGGRQRGQHPRPRACARSSGFHKHTRSCKRRRGSGH